jgi:hypothetical protein
LVDKAGVARGEVNHFVDDVGVHALDEIFQVQVDIIDAGRAWRCSSSAGCPASKWFSQVLALIKVPRDLDILAPLTVT